MNKQGKMINLDFSNVLPFVTKIDRSCSLKKYLLGDEFLMQLCTLMLGQFLYVTDRSEAVKCPKV